jgi:hypothetical protein
MSTRRFVKDLTLRTDWFTKNSAVPGWERDLSLSLKQDTVFTFMYGAPLPLSAQNSMT